VQVGSTGQGAGPSAGGALALDQYWHIRHIRQHMPRTPAGVVPVAVEFVVAVMEASKTDGPRLSQRTGCVVRMVDRTQA
jgi:hypothetical protein